MPMTSGPCATPPKLTTQQRLEPPPSVLGRRPVCRLQEHELVELRPMKITIDLVAGTVEAVDSTAPAQQFALATPEAFALISQAWLRAGWDTKYVYSFSWLGRPIIQLPEDLIRIQEVLYALQPDVILETG